MSRIHIADTGLFVAMGQPSNSRYQAVRRFARRNDITFVLPKRVYEELTVDDPEVGDMSVIDRPNLGSSGRDVCNLLTLYDCVSRAG